MELKQRAEAKGGVPPLLYAPNFLQLRKDDVRRIYLLRNSGGAFSTVPHPPKPRHIGQTVHARGFAYATCYALQPFAAHRCKGRGLGK